LRSVAIRGRRLAFGVLPFLVPSAVSAASAAVGWKSVSVWSRSPSARTVRGFPSSRPAIDGAPAGHPRGIHKRGEYNGKRRHG
jgi:hypothetical protein